MKKVPLIDEVVHEEWESSIYDLFLRHKTLIKDDLSHLLTWIITMYSCDLIAWLHNSTYSIQEELPFLFLCTDASKLTSNFGTQKGTIEMLELSRRVNNHPNSEISRISTDNKTFTKFVKFNNRAEKAIFNPYFIIFPICEFLLRLDLDKKIHELYKSKHIQPSSIENLDKLFGNYLGHYFYEVSNYTLPQLELYYSEFSHSSLEKSFQKIFGTQISSEIIVGYENQIDNIYNNAIVDFISNKKFYYTDDDEKYENNEWLALIDIDEEKSSYFIELIFDFFIEDNISLEKFNENQKVNDIVKNGMSLNTLEIANKLSTYSSVKNKTINCTPTFRANFSENLLSRSPFMPDWFYIAYPDVALWLHKNVDCLQSELDHRKNEFVTNDGSPKNSLFRFLINKYKKLPNKKLECSK